MPIIHHATIHHYRSPPAIVMHVNIPKDKIVPLTQQLKDEYNTLYNKQQLKPEFKERLDMALARIRGGKSRYVEVSVKTGAPWYVIGLIHLMECNCNFACHLHNGDPLSAKTVHEPIGRPLGTTWTWESSAIDAIHQNGFSAWKDWSIAGTLFRLESYNGFGSRNHGVATPYLWSGTQLYTKGKYGSDGKWNPNLVSEQIGAAIVLKALNNKL